MAARWRLCLQYAGHSGDNSTTFSHRRVLSVGSRESYMWSSAHDDVVVLCGKTLLHTGSPSVPHGVERRVLPTGGKHCQNSTKNLAAYRWTFHATSCTTPCYGRLWHTAPLPTLCFQLCDGQTCATCCARTGTPSMPLSCSVRVYFSGAKRRRYRRIQHRYKAPARPPPCSTGYVL